jgi:hypothetical protein
MWKARGGEGSGFYAIVRHYERLPFGGLAIFYAGNSMETTGILERLGASDLGDAASQNRLERFMAKLQSVYDPYSSKNIEKLREFAEDPRIVSRILEKLEECDRATLSEILPNEIVHIKGFWIVLALSNEVAAYQYFDQLADFLMQAGALQKALRPDMLCRCCRRFPQVEALRAIDKKITAYYDGIADTIPSCLWAKQIGLSYPKHYEGEISYGLMTVSDPDVQHKKMTEEQKAKCLMMAVVIYFPISYHDTYSINIGNGTKTIHATFREEYSSFQEKYVRFLKEYEARIPIQGDLLHLKELIAAVEEHYGVKFDRKFTSCYASKGIDKKRIQQWMEEE